MMTVDEAIKYARNYAGLYPGSPLPAVALIVLADEVERLRADLKSCRAVMNEYAGMLDERGLL